MPAFISGENRNGQTVFAGRLSGVREGTVIAALLVGFIARLIGKKLAFLKDMIFMMRRLSR